MTQQENGTKPTVKTAEAKIEDPFWLLHSVPQAGPLTTVDSQVPAQAASCESDSGPNFDMIRKDAAEAERLKDLGLKRAQDTEAREWNDMGISARLLRSGMDLVVGLPSDVRCVWSSIFDRSGNTATTAKKRLPAGSASQTDQSPGWLTGLRPAVMPTMALVLVVVLGFQGYTHWSTTIPPAPVQVAAQAPDKIAAVAAPDKRPALVGVLKRAKRADIAVNPRQDLRGRGQITQVPQHFYTLDPETPYEFRFDVPAMHKYRVGVNGDNKFTDQPQIGDVYSTVDVQFKSTKKNPTNFRVWTNWADYQTKAKIGDVFSVTGQEIPAKQLQKGMTRGVKDVPLYRVSEVKPDSRTYEIQPLRKVALSDLLSAQQSRVDGLRDPQHYEYITYMDTLGKRGLTLSYPDINGHWMDADPVDWEIVPTNQIRLEREKWFRNQANP